MVCLSVFCLPASSFVQIICYLHSAHAEPPEPYLPRLHLSNCWILCSSCNMWHFKSCPFWFQTTHHSRSHCHLYNLACHPPVTRHPCNVDSTFSFFTSFLTFFFFPRALPKGRLLVLIFIIVYDQFYLPNCHSFTHKFIKSCLYWPSFLCRFSVDLHLRRLPLLMVSPGTIMANGDSQMNSSVNLSIHSTQGQGSILIVSHVIFYIFIYYGINEHSLHLKQQQLLVYNI